MKIGRFKIQNLPNTLKAVDHLTYLQYLFEFLAKWEYVKKMSCKEVNLPQPIAFKVESDLLETAQTIFSYNFQHLGIFIKS